MNHVSARSFILFMGTHGDAGVGSWMTGPPSENNLMDMLKTAVTLGSAARHFLESVARSRPAMTLRTMTLRTLNARAARAGDNERGQGLAEYALILALIAIVAISSLVFLGSTISDLFWAPISEDFAEVLSTILGS